MFCFVNYYQLYYSTKHENVQESFICDREYRKIEKSQGFAIKKE